MKIKPVNWFLLASLASVFFWSLVNPHDLFTWFLEVLPVLIGAAVLFVTRKKFKFTQMAYALLWLHALILIYGGKYTYALNPSFEWLKDVMDLDRNYYDRLGHLAQGFIPAIVVREVLIRTSPLRKGKWLFFIAVCICLAVSAFYEFVEWWVAEASGEAGESFLGTQGDVWDTQWDMFLAMIGAIVSQLSLAGLHDRAIARLEGAALNG